MTSLILPAPGVLEERGGPSHYPNPLPEGEGAMVLREFHSKHDIHAGTLRKPNSDRPP
jgi:hypothetical protein